MTTETPNDGAEQTVPPPDGSQHGTPPHGTPPHGTPPHGTLSEEALKLAETLQAWINSGAAMTGAGTASECKVCPICQLINVVNTMRPEVLVHLTQAGTSLAAALQAAMDSSDRMWTSAKRPPVQHIKVT
jgi:hypothetical protein